MTYRLFIKVLLFFTLFTVIPTSQNAESADLESAIYTMVYSGNPNEEEAQWITQAILYSSYTYGVDPLLITAIMDAESSYHHTSLSGAGAIGFMQLMPDTAVAIGVDPYNPLENIIGGTIYLRNQLENFGGWGEYGVTYAVAAYNAGPNAVRNYNGVPPYRETIDYVNNVADAYQRLLYIVQT